MQHLDYEISKPSTIRGYPLHRMVSELTSNESSLFSDEGNTLLVRTSKTIDAPSKPLKKLAVGEISAFELRACVSVKRKGKHLYFPVNDWRSRHEWLRTKATQNGFEILSLHSSQKMTKIDDGKRDFRIDQTDFTGILKVTEGSAFEQALVKGIGSTGRTFGFGLLII